MKRLFFVIPCYNEEEALPETARQLRAKLEALIAQRIVAPDSRILLVDDGSRDKTWETIRALTGSGELFAGLKLSRNRGHQNALLAGLSAASEHCDMAISMDADLQDDIGAVDEMLEKFRGGSDIVYGVRSSRATDTAFKRGSAGAFYKLMTAFGVEIVDNHADYRLMSRRALKALLEFGEVNLFLRGIVPQIGFASDRVFYERNERIAGETKYPLKKMLALAMDGITSFSVKPIKLVTGAGILFAALAAVGLLAMLIASIFRTVPGMLMLGFVIWLLAGIQLIATGVVGEYIGKIYMEVKRRPRFIIEETILN